MPIKPKESSEFISIYRHPVVSVSLSSEWVEEALRYDAHMSSLNSVNWLSGWYAAHRLAKRTFAAYYGTISQFMQRHSSWDAERPKTDYTITNGDLECEVIIHCVPIKDYAPKLGRDFSAKVYYSKGKKERPLIHLFATWWCPVITFIGWLPNASILEKNGKVQIKECDLRPIHDHPVLSKLDTKGMYI